MTNDECKLCGYPYSNGNGLCKDCQKKFDEGLIEYCNACEEFYFVNKGHKCIRAENGLWVASRGEALIANYLYHNNIKFAYDLPIPCNENNNKDTRQKYRYDFYLPDFNLYIEYFGADNKNGYSERVKTKMQIYVKNKLLLLDLTNKDISTQDKITELNNQIAKQKKDDAKIINNYYTDQKNFLENLENCPSAKGWIHCICFFIPLIITSSILYLLNTPIDTCISGGVIAGFISTLPYIIIMENKKTKWTTFIDTYIKNLKKSNDNAK